MKARALWMTGRHVFSPAGYPVMFERQATPYCLILLGPWRCIYRIVTRSAIGRHEFKLMKRRQGRNVPFAETDPIDFFFVAVAGEKELKGFYLLPKSVLRERGYLTAESGMEGKVTLGLIPPFVQTPHKTGTETQAWQRPFYVDLNGDMQEAVARTCKLLGG